MTLLAQPMEGVSSAALSLVVRCGAAYDAIDAAGAASVAAEWLMRGAGDRDSRALNDALDALGCQHHESVQSEHMMLSAAQLGRNLIDVLDIYADIVQRPQLQAETFDPCRMLISQDLDALEDEPARKCNLLLHEKFFPYPLGRGNLGTADTLKSITDASLREHLGKQLNPNGAILAVAGAFDWKEVREAVQRLFGDWSGEAIQSPTAVPPAGGVTHITKDSAQTHIALAHKAVVSRDEKKYYPARIAGAVLSMGMGSRLFTEVREKRGLCYHISCQYGSLYDAAGMFTYAGTRPELAQQTLDVTVEQLRKLAQGVTAEELSRAKTQIRSALVMQGQSTSARAGALVSDWYNLHRLRGLNELSAAVQAVTEKNVTDYLAEYPAANFTILTLGPEPLDTNAAAKE
jgi:predicted Zn-dependent peptidase